MVTAVRGSNFAPLSPFLVQPNKETNPFVSSSGARTGAPASTPTQEETPRKDAAASSEESGEDNNQAQGYAELTAEEQREVQRLRLLDRQVRQHEQAHLSAAGAYAQTGAQFQYETGPDGKKYAVGGEVSISTSKESSPDQTVKKAQIIRRAALAPVDPSAQDRRVASQALRLEAQARAELEAETQATGESEASDGESSQSTGAQSSQASELPGFSNAPGESTSARPAIRTPEVTAGFILDLLG